MSLREVQVIDSHTVGEPTRVVLSGGPELGVGPLTARRDVFRERFDRWRSAIVGEPRGSDCLVGALLCKPEDASCLTGVIFFDNAGYLGMCGHGLIGVVVTLAYLGRLSAGEHRVETPVGVVKVALREDGEVAFENVPAYVSACGVRITAKLGAGGRLEVTGEVAYGGNWFFLTADHGQELAFARSAALVELAGAIRRAVKTQGFPEVNHVALSGPPSRPDAHAKHFVLCPGHAFDRSPCGTGTSAKMACLAASGDLREGERWVQEGILGTTFRGVYRREGDKILPTIRGRAWVTAKTTLYLEDEDPFRWGIEPADQVD